MKLSQFFAIDFTFSHRLETITAHDLLLNLGQLQYLNAKVSNFDTFYGNFQSTN